MWFVRGLPNNSVIREIVRFSVRIWFKIIGNGVVYYRCFKKGDVLLGVSKNGDVLSF